MHQRSWRPGRPGPGPRTRRRRAGRRPRRSDSPVSSRQLPSPLERGSSTPSSRIPAGPVDRLAVEHRPAVVGEVVARRTCRGRGCRRRRLAVRSPRRPTSTESRLNASQVLPGRRCRRRRRRRPSAPAASPTARATWSMPMLSCRSATSRTTVSSSSGSRRSRVGGRLGGVAVERLALVVGRDRALDQPPRLVRGHVAEDLRRRPASSGSGTSGPRNSASGIQSWSLRRRAGSSPLPGLPPQDRGEHDRERHLERAAACGRAGTARGGGARRRATRPRSGPARRSAPRSAAESDHVAERLADLGDLALGLAGDVGVALDQLVGRWWRRSCRA